MSINVIPYFKASGTNFEIGLKIGSRFKQNIHCILDEFEEYKKHLNSYSSQKAYISQMLEVSKVYCPGIIEEIQGIADGSGFDFRDIFVHNCMHMPFWSNCSTSILKQKNAIYIAHNEDAHPLLEKYAYFVFVQSDNPDLVPFFSHCYPGIVPGMSYGFNMRGIVQTCNSLPDPTKSIGIPRMFIGHTIYEKAKSISDAIRIIDFMKPRSGGASYTLGSMTEQKLVNIETTGIDYSIMDIEDRFFRANHYISEKFKFHPPASKHTVTRQNRGENLLPNIQKPSDLLRMMRDNSIYLTMETTQNECQTNSTLIFEIIKDNIRIKKFDEKTLQVFKSLEYQDFI